MNIFNKLELIDRRIQQNTHFFSSTCETFTNKDYILGHKQNFNKFKRLEITQSKNSQWYLTRNQNKKISGKISKYLEIK